MRRFLSLACIVTAAACGSDDSGGPGAPFIGTWSTTTATQSVIDCQFNKDTPNVAITYTVTKGDGADLNIASSIAPSCPLKANVTGTRATVVANQTCVREEDNFKDTFTYATTSVFDMPQGGPATIKLEASFKRATLDGLDTGYECGFTEESPVKKN